MQDNSKLDEPIVQALKGCPRRIDGVEPLTVGDVVPLTTGTHWQSVIQPPDTYITLPRLHEPSDLVGIWITEARYFLARELEMILKTDGVDTVYWTDEWCYEDGVEMERCWLMNKGTKVRTRGRDVPSDIKDAYKRLKNLHQSLTEPMYELATRGLVSDRFIAQLHTDMFGAIVTITVES